MKQPRMTDYKPNYKSAYNKGMRNDKAICIMCFRPIRASKNKHRMVHLVEGNTKILHPGDGHLYDKISRDGGWFEIGSDCAKKLGLEWSVET